MDLPFGFLPASSPVDQMDSCSNLSSLTSTFAQRSQVHCPDFVSTVMTSPDSPINAPKSTLVDLVEDPAERDEFSFDTLPADRNEPMCICDTTFCEHRERHNTEPQPRSSFATDWTMGDDRFADDRLFGERSSKRRKSRDISPDGLASRIGRRFPSLSRRFSRHGSSASFSGTTSRSVPHSRASSVKIASPPQSATFPPGSDPYNIGVSPISSASSQESEVPTSPTQNRTQSVQIRAVTPEEDSDDFQELAQTPLLPPIMTDIPTEAQGKVLSPLHLPTIASPKSPPSTFNYHGIPTPPLSAKPSMASLAQVRHGPVLYPTSEIPPLAISEETDVWAIKLGHANFHIMPEPYLPCVCNIPSCRRLLDDWESARRTYMHQAAHVREHYGQTSQTYKLTEEKWAEIDGQWRTYYEQANAIAEASGESLLFQPLAETKPLSKIPSLTDPQQPSKFLAVDEADIVGPMVQYAKIQHQHRPSASRKSGLFKIFTDPSSLLGGRLTSSSRF